MVSLTQSSSSFLFVSRFCVVLIVILATTAVVTGALVGGDDETQTDIEYFYLNDPSAVPVKEYSSESDIATTINDFQTVKGPKVVEFYSPLCPACLEYKPRYIQLAKDTNKVFPTIQFFAISCDKYETICEEYDVQDYPTVRLFNDDNNDNSNNKNMGQAVSHDILDNPQSLSRALLGEIKSTGSLRTDRRAAEVEKEEKKEEEEDKPEEDEKEAEEETDTKEEEEVEPDEEDEQDKMDEKEDGDDAEETTEDVPDETSEEEVEKTEEKKVDKEEEETDETEEESKDEAEPTEKKVGKDDDDQEEFKEVVEVVPVGRPKEKTQSEDDEGDEERTSGDDRINDEADRDEPDGDEEEERDEEDELHGAFAKNRLIGQDKQEFPDKNRGRPKPGHNTARQKDKQQLDRFKDTIKQKRQDYIQGRTGIGKLLRKDQTRDKRGNVKVPMTPDDMTKGMKQYTPGNVEYDIRRKAILDQVMKHDRVARKDPTSVVLTKESLPFQKDVRKPNLAKKAAEHIPVINRMVKMSAEEELILDVSLSLTVALQTGLSMGIEDLRARKALRDWLDLLSVSLPPEWGIHRMIDELRNKFMFAVKSKENFLTIVKKHPRPRQGWSRSCQKRRTATGFSCGFWKLLHTVTVGVAEQRGGKNLVDSKMMRPGTRVFSPADAADTIRNYIEQFFTCRPCRENFIKNYDDCENNRRCDRLTDNADGATIADWKELPLWLWEVHNEVSVRIVTESAEKNFGPHGVKKKVSVKDELKVIVPNVETCILCFNSDGTWNEGEVFTFLEKSYWPDAEVDPMHDKLLKFDDEAASWFGIMFAISLFIVWAVYSVIGKHSSAIHHTVLLARHAVSRGAGMAMSGGSPKKRSV